MQYTDTEAALIGGLISTYFFQPAVSAPLKDAYRRVLEHLHQNALTSSDLQQIRKAVNFLMPMCQANRQTQRELMGVNMKTTARSCRQISLTAQAFPRATCAGCAIFTGPTKMTKRFFGWR